MLDCRRSTGCVRHYYPAAEGWGVTLRPIPICTIDRLHCFTLTSNLSLKLLTLLHNPRLASDGQHEASKLMRLGYLAKFATESQRAMLLHFLGHIRCRHFALVAE